MPFALVIIGLLMVVTGAKNTYAAFGKQVVADFTGAGNFTYWLAAIGALGALGYIEPFRVFSRLFMGLALVAMILSNQGFFEKLTAALQSGPVKPQAAPEPTVTNSTAANDNNSPDWAAAALKAAPYVAAAIL